MTSELSDRQKEIIEVSIALIAENGIQGLTIKNLAKRIGFSDIILSCLVVIAWQKSVDGLIKS